MIISKMIIEDFEAFEDSGPISFDRGMNIIVGQNSSGKSSIIRSLKSPIPEDVNRRPGKANPSYNPERVPSTRLFLRIFPDDIIDHIAENGEFYATMSQGISGKALIKEFKEKGFVEVEVYKIYGNEAWQISFKFPLRNTPHASFDRDSIIISDDNLNYKDKRSNESRDDMFTMCQQYMSNQVFRFSAERYNVGQCARSITTDLAHDASNLPAVLQTLQSDRGDDFDEIVDNMKAIFSNVGNITPRINENNEVEVRIWPTLAKPELGLSASLNRSGTGISQVLSILTAVVTKKKSTIFVDEISTFIHPAAMKSLMRILLYRYGEHQYILTTHSSEVISQSGVRSVNLVKRDDYTSHVELIGIDELANLRMVCDHLGVSMSDIFAASRIVWVEGPTEELCFPFLYKWRSGHDLADGTVFISVVGTGDFSKKRKDRELIFKIYETVSKSGSKLLSDVIFSFDTEKLSVEDTEKLKRDSKDKIVFLPRRMIECYLIDAEAICALLNERDSFSDHAPQDITDALLKFAPDDRFAAPYWNGRLDDRAWLEKVDAAKLISSALKEVSDCRVEFDKVRDAIFLVRYLIENKPKEIEELGDYILSLVNRLEGEPSVA